jgi:hypothetical protein
MKYRICSRGEGKYKQWKAQREEIKKSFLFWILRIHNKTEWVDIVKLIPEKSNGYYGYYENWFETREEAEKLIADYKGRLTRKKIKCEEAA